MSARRDGVPFGRRRSTPAPASGRSFAGLEAPEDVTALARIEASQHIDALVESLPALQAESARFARWGGILARRLPRGARLLTAGNGGSAAEAQHLTAELVGRFRDDRPPFSAIALNAETSSLTAIGNDYGYDEVFARQITAHARAGDVVMLLSTSGSSPNLLTAVPAARRAGAACWALTGPGPNPLALAADEAICLPGPTATVQEGHLVAVHAICAAFEASLAVGVRETDHWRAEAAND